MIRAKGLVKRYDGIAALDGLDIHVNAGEVYGFIGKNGAGKTTAMNILAGLSRPDKGNCRVNGMDIATIAHPGDLQIGYLPEDPKFYNWMTAREAMAYLGGDVGSHRIREILDWVGLSDSAGRRVGGFSRGMRQRLGIGAALLHDPALLLLDEPSSALDPEGRSRVLQLIEDLRHMGKTILFSTHILSDVERVCDTVGMVGAGKMLLEKPLARLLRENVRPIYDVTTSAPCDPVITGRLLRLPCVKDVADSRNFYSITVSDEAGASLHLLRFFAEERIGIRSFALRQPTLEDLFLQEVCA